MRLISLAAIAALAAGCATAQTPAPAAAPPAATPAPAPTAVATAPLKTASGADAGMVTMFEGPSGFLMRIEGQGWPQGWHGVHLHAVGTCEGPGFTSAGGHVNHAEGARPHGLLNSNGGPDLGDLQNVWAGADGMVKAEVYLAKVGQGMNLMDDDGLSFLVHANADDHVSQPIGGAGARIACGVFQPAR